MMIGKYPSETYRDGGHFNTYFPKNIDDRRARPRRRGRANVRRSLPLVLPLSDRPESGLRRLGHVRDPARHGRQRQQRHERAHERPRAQAAREAREHRRSTGRALRPAQRTAAPTAAPTTAECRSPRPSARSTAARAAIAASSPGSTSSTRTRSTSRTRAHRTSSGPYPAKTLYDQEVWFTDLHIGKVLDYIKAQPWAEDTAIVLTADHGEAFADHGMNWHGQEIWESLIRVPLVVYIPGRSRDASR